MNLSDLGNRIRFLREKLGLTQLQVSNSVLVSSQAVSKWERGENAPDLSLLPDLAKLFGVSIDYLLTGEEQRPDTFVSTVFCTSMRDFREKSSRLSPKEVSQFVNGVFQTLTDIVLSHGGVPVKYVGDGFLAFFNGSNDTERAIESALSCLKSLDKESLLITLDRGPVFCGSIGHSDYSSLDILGESVNKAFLMNQWLTQYSDFSLGVTSSILEHYHSGAISFTENNSSFINEVIYLA